MIMRKGWGGRGLDIDENVGINNKIRILNQQQHAYMKSWIDENVPLAWVYRIIVAVKYTQVEGGKSS